MKRFEKFTWAFFFFVCGHGVYYHCYWNSTLLLVIVVGLWALRNRLDTIRIAGVLGTLLLALRDREKGRGPYGEDAEEVLEEEAARWRPKGGDVCGPDEVTDDVVVVYDGMMPDQEPYTPDERRWLSGLVDQAAKGDPGEAEEEDVLRRRRKGKRIGVS